MIRDVYNASSRILLTAPRRFGKSTNLDMVKRFFEIEVDLCGNRKNVYTTNNYKLFNNYNLQICKDTNFLNEHFGKHPVVYIDFKPLGRVVDSANIFDAFKIIIQNSFNGHRYILSSSRIEYLFKEIADFNATEYGKYISGGITKGVDEINLANSCKHLSTILKRFFAKKVFVLIDSYDAFLESPLFENKTDREKMVSFVESSVGQLFNNVNCVERVLITGLIPVIGEGFLSSENNIECYHFLDSHPFNKYYALTSAEIDTVLSKVIECDKERRAVKNTINDYYNAYETRSRDIRAYNVWSVLQYVWRRTVQSYWCERRYVNKLRKYFKIEPIRQKLEELLSNELKLDISQPLTITDVLKLNSMITSGKDQCLLIEVDLFFILLYHFGYLSVINEFGRGVVCVNIPSEEIKYELAKAVLEENRGIYEYRKQYMMAILSDLVSFQPDSTDLDKNVKQLSTNFYNWNNDVYNCKLTYLLRLLFMNLVTRTIYTRVVGRKLWPNGRTSVLLKNKHQVAICVTGDDSLTAKTVHQKVTSDGGEKHIFDEFNDVRGKVIIVIDPSFRIEYSYYFKTGDSLQKLTS